MTRKPKQAAGILAVCLILFASGACTAGEEHRPLLWYAEESFPFDMTLSASDNVFSMTGERTAKSVTLSVMAPENLAGLTVVYQDGNCILSAGETAIPLSSEAAEGLTVLLDGLLLADAADARIGSAEDGRTTLTADGIILTLDENGLPAAVYHEASGRTAEISVSQGTSSSENQLPKTNSNTNNKDQQSHEHQNKNNGGDLRIRPDP